MQSLKEFLEVHETNIPFLHEFHHVFVGNKITLTATNILLMAVIILLLCLLLEGAEKPKKVVVVDKKQN
jgi:hypothetical protein